VITGVAFFAYAYITRARYGAPRGAALAPPEHVLTALRCRARHAAGPAAERSLVMHSVLTFPNYVVIGVPARALPARLPALRLRCRL
jgi:hypothetical protein